MINLFYDLFFKFIYVFFFFFFSFNLLDLFVCLEASDSSDGSSFFIFDFLKEKWHNYWSNDPHIRMPSSILPEIFYRTGHPIQISDAEKYFFISKDFSIFYNKRIIFNVTNYPFYFFKKNYYNFFYYSSFFDLFVYKYYFFLRDDSFSVNIFKQLNYQSNNNFDISNIYWSGFEKFENYFLNNVYSNYFFNSSFDLHNFFYPIYYDNGGLYVKKTFFNFSLTYFNFYDYFSFKKKFDNVNHFSCIFGSLFFFEKSLFSFSYRSLFINGLFIIFVLIFFFLLYSLFIYFFLVFLFFSFNFYFYDIYIEQDADEYVEFITQFVPSPIESFFGEEDLTNVASRWEFPLLLKDDFFDSSVYEHNYLNYILYSNSYLLFWCFSLNFNFSKFFFFEEKFKFYSILKYKFEVYNLCEYLEDDALEDWEFFPFGIILDAFPEASFYLPYYGESRYAEVYISSTNSILLNNKKFSSDFLYSDFSDSRDFFYIFENSYKHVLWSRHYTTLWPEQDFANFYYEWDECLDPLLYSYLYSSDFSNDFILRYKDSFSSLLLSLQESEKSLFFSGDSNNVDEISSREFISALDFIDDHDSDEFEVDIKATYSLYEGYFELETLKAILIDYDELVEEEPRQDFEDEFILTGYEYTRALLARELFENPLIFNFNYNELGDFKNYIKTRVLTQEEYFLFESYDFHLNPEQVRFFDENEAETYSYLRPEVWYKMTNDVFFFYGLVFPLLSKYIKSEHFWSEEFVLIDHLDAFENLMDLDGDINEYPELSDFYKDDYSKFGFMTFNHFKFNEDNTVSVVHLGLNSFIENINSNFNTIKMPPYGSYLGALLLPPQIRLSRDLYILNYLKNKNMFLFFLHLNFLKNINPIIAFEFSLSNTYILDEFALPEGMSVSGVDNFFNSKDYKTNSNIKEYIEQVEVIEEEDVDLTFWYDLDNDNFETPFSYMIFGVGVPFLFIGLYSFILYCRF